MTRSGSIQLVEHWVAARAIPGQDESGDQYLVTNFPGGVLTAVVDGLGHGKEAHKAAMVAISTLAAAAGEPVTALFQRCHEALRKTRGAVMTLACFNADQATLTWLAVGNVEAYLLRAEEPDAKPIAILPRGGIVGDRLPNLNPVTLPVYQDDLLLLATDGIGSAFVRDVRSLEQPRHLINHIFTQHAKHTDDALILGVQWKNGNRASEMRTS